MRRIAIIPDEKQKEIRENISFIRSCISPCLDSGNSLKYGVERKIINLYNREFTPNQPFNYPYQVKNLIFLLDLMLNSSVGSKLEEEIKIKLSEAKDELERVIDEYMDVEKFIKEFDEKLVCLTSSKFEDAVAIYLFSEGYHVITRFCPPIFEGKEIDIFAEKIKDKVIEIIFGECKFRYYSNEVDVSRIEADILSLLKKFSPSTNKDNLIVSVKEIENRIKTAFERLGFYSQINFELFYYWPDLKSEHLFLNFKDFAPNLKINKVYLKKANDLETLYNWQIEKMEDLTIITREGTDE
ncbi:MAG: hypothetical protein B5M53_06780 [Candidatus Cloacimonas sp. 4484_209]|nr:MAG: hypothetical protein B5M53_06780 [Candidatus Cloacimonas sp. 4484_209]